MFSPGTFPIECWFCRGGRRPAHHSGNCRIHFICGGSHTADCGCQTAAVCTLTQPVGCFGVVMFMNSSHPIMRPRRGEALSLYTAHSLTLAPTSLKKSSTHTETHLLISCVSGSAQWTHAAHRSTHPGAFVWRSISLSTTSDLSRPFCQRISESADASTVSEPFCRRLGAGFSEKVRPREFSGRWVGWRLSKSRKTNKLVHCLAVRCIRTTLNLPSDRACLS